MWCGMVWHGGMWCGMACGVVLWYGDMACGVLWCGVVWCVKSNQKGVQLDKTNCKKSYIALKFVICSKNDKFLLKLV